MPAVDVTVYHRGFHGDLNETYFVGEVSAEARDLVTVTWECLQKAMDIGESTTLRRTNRIGIGSGRTGSDRVGSGRVGSGGTGPGWVEK